MTALEHDVQLPTDETVGELEFVHAFTGPMPTGVSVSHTRPILVNFPQWGREPAVRDLPAGGGRAGGHRRRAAERAGGAVPRRDVELPERPGRRERLRL